MRAMLGLVIAMGVLIVAGVAVIGVTLVHRLGAVGAAPAPPDIVLDQPPGTAIVGATAIGTRLAVVLHGGGAPDRVVLLEGGRVVGTLRLSPH